MNSMRDSPSLFPLMKLDDLFDFSFSSVSVNDIPLRYCTYDHCLLLLYHWSVTHQMFNIDNVLSLIMLSLLKNSAYKQAVL